MHAIATDEVIGMLLVTLFPKWTVLFAVNPNPVMLIVVPVGPCVGLTEYIVMGVCVTVPSVTVKLIELLVPLRFCTETGYVPVAVCRERIIHAGLENRQRGSSEDGTVNVSEVLFSDGTCTTTPYPNITVLSLVKPDPNKVTVEPTAPDRGVADCICRVSDGVTG